MAIEEKLDLLALGSELHYSMMRIELNNNNSALHYQLSSIVRDYNLSVPKPLV